MRIQWVSRMHAGAARWGRPRNPALRDGIGAATEKEPSTDRASSSHPVHSGRSAKYIHQARRTPLPTGTRSPWEPLPHFGAGHAAHGGQRGFPRPPSGPQEGNRSQGPSLRLHSLSGLSPRTWLCLRLHVQGLPPERGPPSPAAFLKPPTSLRSFPRMSLAFFFFFTALITTCNYFSFLA